MTGVELDNLQSVDCWGDPIGRHPEQAVSIETREDDTIVVTLEDQVDLARVRVSPSEARVLASHLVAAAGGIEASLRSREVART